MRTHTHTVASSFFHGPVDCATDGRPILQKREMTSRALLSASSFVALVAALGSTACGVDPTASEPTEESVFRPAPTPTSPAGSATPFPSATSPSGAPFELGDVAILYPLPTKGSAGALLRASDEGTYGPMLSRAMFEAIAPTGSLDTESPSDYESLSLVSARLESCYYSSCEIALRLVFQPVSTDPASGDTTAGDAAIHVTYPLDAREVVRLAEEIRDARRATWHGASLTELGVHPTLATQGLAGPFAGALAKSILARTGARAISKVSALGHRASSGGEHTYTFASFVANQGALFPAAIPAFGRTTQTIVGSSPRASLEASHMRVDTVPERDSVLPLLARDRPASAEGAPALAEAFAAAGRLQTPQMHDPSRTDCASCHAAEGARRVGAKVYRFEREPHRSPDLDVGHVDERVGATNFHAFGYLGRDVCIMQRTATEAARTAQRQLDRDLTTR